MGRAGLGSLIGAIVGAGAAGALAQSTDAPPVITNPTWLSKPTGDTLAGLYPAAAQYPPRPGRVLMRCQVKIDGTLQYCIIVAEDPPGLGFGAASLQAARYFRMRPPTIDGKPFGGAIVTIPIAWRMAGGSNPPPLKPPQWASGAMGMLIRPAEAGATAPGKWLALPCMGPEGQFPCQYHFAEWKRQPTPEDLLRVRKAIGSKDARLNCKIGEGGLLADCQAPGLNATAAQALLSLAPLYQTRAPLDDGTDPKGATLTIRLLGAY